MTTIPCCEKCVGTDVNHDMQKMEEVCTNPSCPCHKPKEPAWDEVESALTTDREETLRVLEGMKQKHWVFECSGPRPDKTTKFEDWCDDPECRSDDNKRVKAHNTALDDAISELKKIWNTN